MQSRAGCGAVEWASREYAVARAGMAGLMKRVLARFLLATCTLGSAGPAAASESESRRPRSSDEELDDDTVEHAIGSLVATERELAGAYLASLLDELEPFDATRAAALAALSPRADVRRALADALGARFHLVGDSFVLDHLRHDADPAVRAAALRALDGRIGVVAKFPLR
jgi:hypothetical protein